MIAEAVNKWNADNGTTGEYLTFWTSGDRDELTQMLASKLNSAAVCINSQVGACGGSHMVRPYKKLNDGFGNTTEYSYFQLNRIVTNDGMFIAVYPEVQNGSCTHTYWSRDRDDNGNFIPDSSSHDGYKGQYVIATNCGFIFFDTNGKKSPNQMGIDCFALGFKSDGAFYYGGNTYGNLGYVLLNDKLIETENYTPGKF